MIHIVTKYKITNLFIDKQFMLYMIYLQIRNNYSSRSNSCNAYHKNLGESACLYIYN